MSKSFLQKPERLCRAAGEHWDFVLECTFPRSHSACGVLVEGPREAFGHLSLPLHLEALVPAPLESCVAGRECTQYLVMGTCRSMPGTSPVRPWTAASGGEPACALSQPPFQVTETLGFGGTLLPPPARLLV